MSRIRTIKPEFNKHEGLFDAETETGLPLRVAYPGLWMHADREGRFKWEVRRLKSEILPYDDLDFSRVLDALATRGFLVKYACGTEVYGWIPSFTKHQIVNNRERESELPSVYDENSEILIDGDNNIEKYKQECGLATRDPRVSDACSTENRTCKDFLKWKGTGREQEGKGREQKINIPHVVGEKAADSLVTEENSFFENQKPGNEPSSTQTGENTGDDGSGETTGGKTAAASDKPKTLGAEALVPCPHEKILEIYHRVLPMCRPMKIWNDTRKKYLKTRWAEERKRQNLDWWEGYFEYVKKSNFLVGKTQGQNGKPPFVADLEWLIRPENFAKVVEGKYHHG